MKQLTKFCAGDMAFITLPKQKPAVSDITKPWIRPKWEACHLEHAHLFDNQEITGCKDSWI